MALYSSLTIEAWLWIAIVVFSICTLVFALANWWGAIIQDPFILGGLLVALVSLVAVVAKRRVRWAKKS